MPVAAPSVSASAAGQHPDWYPAWARRLGDLYLSGANCVFILHGNVHDLIHNPGGATLDAPGDSLAAPGNLKTATGGSAATAALPDGGDAFGSLTQFLATQVFGRWDLVVGHDLSRGLQPQPGRDPQRLRAMMQTLSARWGEPSLWSREPDRVLGMLENYVERTLVEEPAARKSLAVMFEYAQYLTPAGDLDALTRGPAARLVQFLRWAQNPHIKRSNMAFVLIADKLSELNDRLVQSPHVATIEIPLPDEAERLRFIEHTMAGRKLADVSDFDAPHLARMSNGLSLVNLNVILSETMRPGARIDLSDFRRLKRTMIERQCQGLVEFIEPGHTLDLLIGVDEAKKQLENDARFITAGQLDVAPMGYLVCGPVGTGKSFLAECYAGSIGIPCAVLRNFRSKYVGETEGNLEQVLTVLRSLGPVVVVVDEADAALGNRRSDGDSGTSSRVFSMIAAQMGNTRYRGKIVWMLLTSRPDLLPIDLKRQGRAEVHIPLFYPLQEIELRTLLEAMARKNKVQVAPDAWPTLPTDRRLSGADIETIVLSAKRAALTAGRTAVAREDFDRAATEFIPSAQGLEKELQEIAAVLECTQLGFLPSHWREKVQQPEGRALLQARMMQIRHLIES